MQAIIRFVHIDFVVAKVAAIMSQSLDIGLHLPTYQLTWVVATHFFYFHPKNWGRFPL